MQEKKKGVAKVTPMAFGRRMGEDTGPRSVMNLSMLAAAYCQRSLIQKQCACFLAFSQFLADHTYM